MHNYYMKLIVDNAIIKKIKYHQISLLNNILIKMHNLQ